MNMKHLDNMPDLLSVQEAAEYFGISNQYIRRQIKAGKIVAISIARKYRIPKTEIYKMLPSA